MADMMRDGMRGAACSQEVSGGRGASGWPSSERPPLTKSHDCSNILTYTISLHLRSHLAHFADAFITKAT